MDAAVVIFTGSWVVCGGVVVWQRAMARRATRRADALDMIDAEAASTLAAARADLEDAAAREAEFRRLTDPEAIDWDSARVQAGVDRLIAEIRAQALLDRIHDFQRDRDDVVIDLRDGKDGAP